MSSETSHIADLAERFVVAHDAAREAPPVWAQALNVAGEAGEFVEAFRRWTGHARREGSREETALELADVVISAFVFAKRAGIDLDEEIRIKGEIICSRGFGGRR